MSDQPPLTAEAVEVFVASLRVNTRITWVFRDFGETACETRTLLGRFWLTMVLKRAGRIS